jgi:hypothetical protein
MQLALVPAYHRQLGIKVLAFYDGEPHGAELMRG